MNVNDPTIVSLRTQLMAAREELDLVVAFHEVWKPSAYDKALHKRMGVSFATHAFHIVRASLRREMLLALMRLWDKNSRFVRMDFIGRSLGNRTIINALARDRVMGRFGDLELEAEMRKDMSRRAKKVTDLISEYSKDGPRFAVLEKMRNLRHQRLAHRTAEPIAAIGAELTDKEIETFYQDNSKIISVSLSLVAGIGYDPEQTAEVYRYYSKFFWAGACGERNERHPIHRTPPQIAHATR